MNDERMEYIRNMYERPDGIVISKEAEIINELLEEIRRLTDEIKEIHVRRLDF